MEYTFESASGLRQFRYCRRSPIEYLSEAGARGIDKRSLWIGPRRIFRINHPDLIKDVLVTHSWNFVEARVLRVSKPILGKGLLTSDGDTWSP